MSSLLTAVLTLSLFLVAYSYIGYPLLIAILARFWGRPYKPLELEGDHELPFLSVLIAAYNSESHIESRIRNLLSSDYPGDRLEIVVASDGSTDGTVERVKRLGFRNVSVVPFQRRRGKTKSLVSSVSMLSGDVIIFTDVSTQFEPDALRKLARHFVDPEIGVVSGKVMMLDDQHRSSEGFYWKLESKVKQWEARFDSLIGASGAIYAVRRLCFTPPITPQINDDLVLPMLTRMRTRCRMVLDTSAVAKVVMPGGVSNEFRRRVRIGIGAFQSLSEVGRLANPAFGRLAFSFISHKLIRWFTPLLLAVAFVASLCLSTTFLGTAALSIQLGFYATALAGLIASGTSTPVRMVRLTTSFCAMNAALFVGFCRWLVAPSITTWEPTIRPLTDSPASPAKEVPQPYRLKHPQSIGERHGRRQRQG